MGGITRAGGAYSLIPGRPRASLVPATEHMPKSWSAPKDGTNQFSTGKCSVSCGNYGMAPAANYPRAPPLISLEWLTTPSRAWGDTFVTAADLQQARQHLHDIEPINVAGRIDAGSAARRLILFSS